MRPYIYRLAKKHTQQGWVANTDRGVSIAVEGHKTKQQRFLTELPTHLPAYAQIDTLETQQQPLSNFHDFKILPSLLDGQPSAFILPDIKPCTACIADIETPSSRYFRYPYTSCSQCGPRYSIIRQQPYDRLHTSMSKFNMCQDCKIEFNDPENRRFHAQTIACSNCGPYTQLLSTTGQPLFQQEQALEKALHLLSQGKIIAVKAIGGFQLLVDASNQNAVLTLRRRKQRPQKPFALLLASLEQAHTLCHIQALEAEQLTAPGNPIVLMQRLHSAKLADAVAPHLCMLGIMLPASPLQHLLAKKFGKPLVATSGNRAGEPICIHDDQALDRLSGIADFFLTHDREIFRPLDDSIVRCINGKATVLRRARGYTPLPISISRKFPATLALGGQWKSTVAVNCGNQLILSQHLADLDTADARLQFRHTLDELQNLYHVKPTRVVHDRHPDYYSSQYAEQHAKNKVAVQHHYAHILSCMAEHDLKPPVLGFAWDGTGLGMNNDLWGGETLLIEAEHCRHFAHLQPFPLPGGDSAAREPRRAALGLLYAFYADQLFMQPQLDSLSAFSHQEITLFRQSLSKNLNTPQTSSMGRLFDAVASLTGLCHINTYEGQAAVLLEQQAETVSSDACYPFFLEQEEALRIDWKPIINGLLLDIQHGNIKIIAAKFHNTLAAIMFQIAEKANQQTIVLSGGCFQNARLTECCVKKLKNAGFSVYTHEKIPPNDGGLALGQLYARALKPDC